MNEALLRYIDETIKFNQRCIEIAEEAKQAIQSNSQGLKTSRTSLTAREPARQTSFKRSQSDNAIMSADEAIRRSVTQVPQFALASKLSTLSMHADEPPAPRPVSVASTKMVKALFDFEAESGNELSSSLD